MRTITNQEQISELKGYYAGVFCSEIVIFNDKRDIHNFVNNAKRDVFEFMTQKEMFKWALSVLELEHINTDIRTATEINQWRAIEAQKDEIKSLKTDNHLLLTLLSDFLTKKLSYINYEPFGAEKTLTEE